MKKYKILIIICVIVILMISGILIYLQFMQPTIDNEYASDDGNIDLEEDESYEVDTILKQVDNRSYYCTVQDISESYIYLIIDKDTDTLLKILAPKYISEYNINKSNVISKLDDFVEKNDEGEIPEYEIMIDKMYVSKQGKINTFFVYIDIINPDNEEIIKTSFMVEMDLFNEVYYILPYDYMNKKGYLNLQEGQRYENSIDEIKDYGLNEFEFQIKNDNLMIYDFMNKLVKMTKYDVNNSYNLYSAEYKKAKFDTLSKYRDYVQNNMENMTKSIIQKYKVEEHDNYTDYICVDQNGEYYIFRESAVMQYEIQLKTVDIDEEELEDINDNWEEEIYEDYDDEDYGYDEYEEDDDE